MNTPDLEGDSNPTIKRLFIFKVPDLNEILQEVNNPQEALKRRKLESVSVKTRPHCSVNP